MRRMIRAAALAAAVSAAWISPVLGADAASASSPATAQAQVPVKQVVLFSSGVGYFEHFGTVSGDGSTELRFKSAQINDILKSLILQDLDNGRITTISYPSQDPVAKTLRSFQVDITNNPSLADLLNQLRGAKVSVESGATRLSGIVLGVEKKQRPAGGDKNQLVDAWYLNLIVGASIRPVPLDEVRDVQLDDPRLRDELASALAALASARDQDKKPVTVNFTGRGQRRVRLGYVVETPVWKTSYRLIMDAADEKAAEKDKKAVGRTAPTNDGGKLQGWAIVENQTDNDWTDVQLSLVSGRPISFIQDLYQPLYIPRPVVQAELYASLRPQTYEGGLNEKRELQEFAAKPAQHEAEVLGRKAGAAGGADRATMLRARMAAPMATAAAASAPEQLADSAMALGIDPSSSVSSIASAAKVGELFQYTVGSVSLPRQKSAMIPIITDAIEVERLSIYNPQVLPKNPLNGARLKNTTGKHLLQGPVTVLDGGAYAGDAKIEDLPPGQERLISYGVDQQVMVNATANRQDNAIQTGKIVKGVLQVTRKLVFSQDYVAENKADHAKTLLIEHPLRRGWMLVEPAKAQETTDTLYRFKGKVEAGKGTKLTVREELITGESIAILPTDAGQLWNYVRTAEIPKDVREAVGKAIQLKGALVDTQRDIQQRQQKVAEITQEQSRLRENMKTVAPNSDYYSRLLKKLDEQETSIEKLQQEIVTLNKQMEQQRASLENYLANLNVG